MRKIKEFLYRYIWLTPWGREWYEYEKETGKKPWRGEDY